MKPRINTPLDNALMRSMTKEGGNPSKIIEPNLSEAINHILPDLPSDEPEPKTGRKNKNTGKHAAGKKNTINENQLSLGIDINDESDQEDAAAAQAKGPTSTLKGDLLEQMAKSKDSDTNSLKYSRDLTVEDIQSALPAIDSKVVNEALAIKQSLEAARLQDEQNTLNEPTQSYTDKINRPAAPTYPEPNQQVNTGRVVVTATKRVDFVNKEKPKDTPKDEIISSENWDKINDEIREIHQQYKEQEVTIDVKNELERIMPPPIFDTHLPCLVFYKEDAPLVVVNTLSFKDFEDRVERLENRIHTLFSDNYKIANIFSLVADKEHSSRFDSELALIDLQVFNDTNNYVDLVTLLMGYDISDLNNYALGFNAEIGTRVLARLEEYHLPIAATPVLSDAQIKQSAYLENIRAACLKPLRVSNIEAIGQIRNLSATVHKAQSLKQDYNFFKKKRIQLSTMTEMQNQIYASYAQELILKNQGDTQDYESFVYSFWDIYVKTHANADTIYTQYMHIDKLLNFYLTQINNLGWLEPGDFKDCAQLIALTKAELTNTLTGMLCLTDCQSVIKQGILPVIFLFDTHALINLTHHSNIVLNNVANQDRLLIHAYMAVYGHINSLITHQTKSSALLRLEALLQGLLGVNSTHFGQKLPELPLGCAGTLAHVFKEKMGYQLANFTMTDHIDVQTVESSHAIVVAYRLFDDLKASLPHHKGYALFAPDTNETVLNDNLLSLFEFTNQLYVYSFNGKTYTHDYYQANYLKLPVESASGDTIKKKTTPSSTSNVRIAPHNFLDKQPSYVDKAVFVNKILLNDEIKANTGMQFIYRYINYQPIDYAALLTKLRSLIDEEYHMIEQAISEMPVELLARMRNPDFYSDAANFSKLDEKQKYIAAYRYLNPHLPEAYFDDLKRRTSGIYVCKALRLTPKKTACPNFLRENTPAIPLLFGIQSNLNKDFFYERDEWLIDLGVFWMDGVLTQLFYHMGDEVLHQQRFEQDKVNVWLDNAGLVYQTHFLHWESVCFLYHNNNLIFTNTASRHYLGNAFYQYSPSSGMDKLVASFHEGDIENSDLDQHGISSKSLILKDHTEKVFNIFSWDYS